MPSKNKTYKALVSSDWNQCLAPCGPFDFISFHYPECDAELLTIFKNYTGNMISLGEAVGQIQRLLPGPITPEQMDAYLKASFRTYQGLAELIDWCDRRDILFMVNTTGMIGYFQRILANGRLPQIPVLSAHPMVRYTHQDTDPGIIFDLFETDDKSKNTAAAMHAFNIPVNKIILMGDSGGDGPHFEWGAGINAFLIAVMAKTSLIKYCEQKEIVIDLQFGPCDADGNPEDVDMEQQVDFMDLVPVIEDIC